MYLGNLQAAKSMKCFPVFCETWVFVINHLRW